MSTLTSLQKMFSEIFLNFQDLVLTLPVLFNSHCIVAVNIYSNTAGSVNRVVKKLSDVRCATLCNAGHFQIRTCAWCTTLVLNGLISAQFGDHNSSGSIYVCLSKKTPNPGPPGLHLRTATLNNRLKICPNFCICPIFFN